MSAIYDVVKISLFDGGNDYTRITLMNSETDEYATIIPELGGAVEQLCLLAPQVDELMHILASPTPREFRKVPIPTARKDDWLEAYKSGVHGSILAPWVNRIDHGKYEFYGREYTLPINEPARDNALHGLVYSRSMEIVETSSTSECAQCTLQYKFNASPDSTFAGYPFHVTMRVVYELKESKLSIRTHAEVFGGTTHAPFCVGWHPYITFEGDSINRAKLSVPIGTRLVFSERMIPVTTNTNYGINEVMGGKTFDDCFGMRSSEHENIALTHPMGAATATVWGSPNVTHFQLYTPPSRHSIAVEPCTAQPNAFNSNSCAILTPEAQFDCVFGITLS